MSKFIQKYQGSDKTSLFQFATVKTLKVTDAVQVTSWVVSNLPSLYSFQYDNNEGDRKVLSHKKRNLMNDIFGQFDQMM